MSVDEVDPAATHGLAAVIGDVVESRRAGPEMFDRLHDALSRVNDRLEALQPLQITIGDEFQGVYRRLGQALNATLLVRLLLHEVTEVRFAVGWGSFTRWNPERAPYAQDGPAWWAAREALEAVDRQEGGIGTPAGWRTAVRLGLEPPDGVDVRNQDGKVAAGQTLAEPGPLDVSLGTAVDGLVMFRDQVLSRLDRRDTGLVLALLEGMTVTHAAQQVGISQQAASRRLRANGGYALVHSWRLLEGGS